MKAEELISVVRRLPEPPRLAIDLVNELEASLARERSVQATNEALARALNSVVERKDRAEGAARRMAEAMRCAAEETLRSLDKCD